MKLNTLTTVVLGGVVSMASAQLSLYVAPNGNDNNPGTMAQPFATLDQARDALRIHKQAGKTTQGATVWLRGGLHILPRTFDLTPEDSGAADAPVIYAAYPGETPVVSGGMPINGWRLLAEEREDVSESAEGHVWVADIPKGVRFHSMFADGVKQPVAATPNGIGDYRNRRVYPQIVKWGPVDPKGQKLTFPEGALDHVPDNGDVEVWLPINNWCFQKVVLRDIDREANTGRRCSRMPAYHSARPRGYGCFGFPFRIENALICLDSPGEWCVDSEAGRVYYWPLGTDMNGVEVMASRLQHLVRAQGDEAKQQWVKHVEFKGITFQHADRMPEDQWPSDWVIRNFQNPDSALRFEGVEYCRVDGCTILDPEAGGIGLYRHAQWNTIAGNHISGCGSSGVGLSGFGAGGPDENRFNVVVRNYIHHPGQVYNKSSAIWIWNSGSNEIAQNFIYATPYAGLDMTGVISPDWNKKRDPVKQGNSDGYGHYGAIYQFQWDRLPEGWHERWLAGTGTVGFWDWQPYALARNNNCHHNIVVEPETHTTEGGAFYTSDGAGADNHWHHNLVYKSGDMGESTTFALDGKSFFRFTIEDNVIWAEKHILNVASARRSEVDGRATETVVRNNFRVKPKSGLSTQDENGALKTPFPFDRFVDLYRDIRSGVAAAGGWPGKPPIYLLPVVGRPLVCIGTVDGNTDFVGSTQVKVEVFGAFEEIRYTTDGSEPTERSSVYRGPIEVTEAMTIKALAYYTPRFPRAPAIMRRHTPSVSLTLRKAAEPLAPVAGVQASELKPGLSCAYFDGATAFGGETGISKLPQRFNRDEARKQLVVPAITLDPREAEDDFAFEFSGYIKIDKPGIYSFYLASDDGSRLVLNDEMIVDNDGVHNTAREVRGDVPLESGFYAFRLDYFEGKGAHALRASYSGPGLKKQIIPASALFHRP